MYNFQPIDDEYFARRGPKSVYDGINIGKSSVYLTRKTLERLGNPTHIEFKVDQDGRFLLIYPTYSDAEKAHKISRDGHTKSSGHVSGAIMKAGLRGRYYYLEDFDGGIVLSHETRAV